MTAYRATACALALALTLAGTLALVINDERWDTLLGGVTGASAALLLGCLLGMALERRRRQREADAAFLDRLEPLHVARRDRA